MTGHKTSATQVPFFCSGFISHSAYLSRTETRKGGPSVHWLRQSGSTLKRKRKCSRTRGGGADASLGIEKFVELDIEHGLTDATCEHVPGEADHLLGPGEGVDDVIELWAQTLVSEHGELVEPWVVDEAGIAQPVDRELGVLRIRDDCSNHADLKGSKRNQRHNQFTDERIRGA